MVIMGRAAKLPIRRFRSERASLSRYANLDARVSASSSPSAAGLDAVAVDLLIKAASWHVCSLTSGYVASALACQMKTHISRPSDIDLRKMLRRTQRVGEDVAPRSVS